jgi:hypothetical protein
MPAYENTRMCLTSVLQHGHDKMVGEVLELFGFQECDLTADEHKLLRAFDPGPKVDALLTAVERRLNQRRSNASS